jgi:hypothetical protein
VALLDSEIQRIRFELGYTVLGVNSEPYVEYFGTIDRIVALYLNAGATTTSTTTVAVSDTLTQRTLTLASATGFVAGATIYVDVLPQQERAVVQSISGSNVVVYLQKAHVGLYPVTVDGAPLNLDFTADAPLPLQQTTRIVILRTTTGTDTPYRSRFR